MIPGNALASLLGLLLAAGGEPASVTAVHDDGITFLTWIDDEDTLGDGSAPLAAVRRAQGRGRGVRYKVVVLPGEAGSPPPGDGHVEGAVVATAGPLSAWNVARLGIRPAAGARVSRYRFGPEGVPVPPGRGLVATGAAREGRRCLAVVRVTGSERRRLGAACLDERLGEGRPVLQERTEGRFHGVDGATVERWVRWELPPRAPAARPFDYLVALPPDRPERPAAGLFLHAWGGSAETGYGVWHGADQGTVLVAANQDPYDWWTGYAEELVGGPATSASKPPPGAAVRAWTQRRLIGFLDFAVAHHHLDERRLFVAGTSMGGTGASMLALRWPDRFAWARSDVGVHAPRLAPAFRRSFSAVWGPPDAQLPFVVEEPAPLDPPAWDHFDNPRYLAARPDADLPLLCFANGKNDDKVGWAQALAMLRALQEGRHPHVFVWGQDGHDQRARLPGGTRGALALDVRNDASLPAFTGSSLDDDPGRGRRRGDGWDGKSRGQVNLWLLWEPDTIVDEPDRWEVSLRIADGAPAPRATVDVTARRLQRLTPAPGERFAVEVTGEGGEVVHRGEAVVDDHRRLTAAAVPLARAARRLSLRRLP